MSPCCVSAGADAVITSSAAVGRLLGLAAVSPAIGSTFEDLLTSGGGPGGGRASGGPPEEVGKAPIDITPERVVAVVRNRTLRRYYDPVVARLEAGDKLVVVRKADAPKEVRDIEERVVFERDRGQPHRRLSPADSPLHRAPPPTAAGWAVHWAHFSQPTVVARTLEEPVERIHEHRFPDSGTPGGACCEHAVDAGRRAPAGSLLHRTRTAPGCRCGTGWRAWVRPDSPQAAVLEPLFKVLKSNHPKADTAVVGRAYRTAEHYHRDQTRKSGGDPYITHPLAVATILAELGMTEPTIVAALLHDTVEDTSYTLEQLTADFGTEVATMVDGVTKLDKITYGESAQAETIRKMIVAMSRDIRVLVIKLADRLHNMRTLHFLRPDKQVRIAKETLEIFAPLAHRLGMNAIKWELEDLAFSTMQPKVYDEIVQLVAERAPRAGRRCCGR